MAGFSCRFNSFKRVPCSSVRCRDRSRWTTARSSTLELSIRGHGGWVEFDFTRPGEPTDNGLRDECLNLNEFASIEDAGQWI